MIDIHIRQVDPNYLNFLRSFDSHVPEKGGRPWLWPVRINGIDYGIPLTTQDSSAGIIGYMRCMAIPEHGLQLRFMAPVPYYALLPPERMSAALMRELTSYELSRKYIEEEARILHRLSGLNQMDKIWMANSCNFAELESVYLNWQPGVEAGIFLYPQKEDFTMPISKGGTPYYTKEQYEQARYNSSALEYARSRGYELKKEGPYYKMRDHDSMVFTPRGNWFWNSRGLSGGALEFMIYYEGKTLVEAVLTLAGEQELTLTQTAPVQHPTTSAPYAPKPDTEQKKPFTLPDRASNFKAISGYLCNARGLEKGVLQEMLRQKVLYQSIYVNPVGRSVFNATFVYYDPSGNAVGAFQRGLMDKEGTPPYKRDVPGSDKRWGWLLRGEGQISTVAVFEGAIDAASDASLLAINNKIWTNVDRLSLEGLGPQPLYNYLKEHPDVRQVVLMLDADGAGRAAAAKLAAELKEQGYTVEDRVPPFGKDWNDVLTDTRAMEEEQKNDPPNRTPEIPESPEI